VIKLGAKCGHIIEAARKITGMSQVMVWFLKILFNFQCIIL
jgi:hypothetical protein